MASKVFSTPGWTAWNVPTGVKNVEVTIDGAGSGTRRGGRITGKLAVSDKWNLYVLVGAAGRTPSGGSGGAATTGGGGAGGGGNFNGGGWSGGGASAIRVNSTTGTLKAVAGGAGGASGDTGLGGAGGNSISGPLTGGHGSRGTAGTGETGDATGGTQAQGGNGGTSSRGVQYNGHNASDDVLAAGGAGGSAGASIACHGGGGGGGGYHPGGGGQASAPGYTPGGGGGGGSNYTAGLTGETSEQGVAGTGNGTVTLSWVAPGSKNLPPTPPSEVKLNDVDITDEMLTKATSSVKISAKMNDPNSGEKVALVAQWSTSSDFTAKDSATSPQVVRTHRATVTLSPLSQNTHYYVRLYARDQHGLTSSGYTSVDFWTNRASTTTDLTVNTQGSGMTLPVLSSATFSWIHNDPDISDFQTAFQLRYRVASTSVTPAGAWVLVTETVGQNLPPRVEGPPSSAKNEWVFNPGFFKGSRFYEWQVRTRDGQGLWGDFGVEIFTFFVSSTSSPPVLLLPPNGTPVDLGQETVLFDWLFVDPEAGDVQVRADLRYRVVGPTKEITSGAPPNTGDWTTALGTAAPGTPGAVSAWTLPSDLFVAEYTYEWEVRTYDELGAGVSDWSDPFRFYAIATPGALAGGLPVSSTLVQGELGCGTYRVFIYQQGGQVRIGEMEPITRLSFKRLRDDIGNCVVLSGGYSADCGALYAMVRTWMHELVVFRDGVRVWEGPITRITYTTTSVEYEAKDVMAYAYRRIMRQGYNDAFRLIKAGVGSAPDEFLGLLSVVKRAAMILTQALAPFDPNVLPYLTAIEYPDDAQESRVVADWSRTAWEEVDDLAATAGLDYTTVGRRILLWDTHRAIGRLPELRDGDFSDSPIVTEYGMQLATLFAVTNNSGVVGWTEVAAKADPYGPVELLASAYKDTASASEEILTPEALEKSIKTLTEQSQRNISGRWPAPLVVRVPDNSTLSPRANLGFQQLIPGVWLPLRSVNTVRQVLQWQKLDSVDVGVDEKGEVIKVVLSPAPNGGQDPDADAAAEDAAG